MTANVQLQAQRFTPNIENTQATNGKILLFRPMTRPLPNIPTDGYFGTPNTDNEPSPTLPSPTDPTPTFNPNIIVRLLSAVVQKLTEISERLASLGGIVRDPADPMTRLDNSNSAATELPIGTVGNDINAAQTGPVVTTQDSAAIDTTSTPENNSFLQSFNNLFNGLKEAFNDILSVKGDAGNIFGMIRKGFSSFVDFAKPLVQGAGEFLTSPLRSDGSIFKKGWDFVKGLF